METHTHTHKSHVLTRFIILCSHIHSYTQPQTDHTWNSSQLPLTSRLGVHMKSETKRPSFCRTPTPSKSEARRTLTGQDLLMESLLSVRVLMYLAFFHPMPTFLFWFQVLELNSNCSYLKLQSGSTTFSCCFCFVVQLPYLIIPCVMKLHKNNISEQLRCPHRHKSIHNQMFNIKSPGKSANFYNYQRDSYVFHWCIHAISEGQCSQ